MSTAYITIVTAAASVGASAIIGVLLYLATRRVQDPSWARRSNNVLRDHVSRIEGVNITFDGQSVSSLTISRIVLWNRGRDAISSSDITEPIKLVAVGDIEILETRILQVTRPANLFELSDTRGGTECEVSFHYLGHGDGAVIQVIHTGVSSRNLDMTGQFKNAGRVTRRNISVPRPQEGSGPRAFTRLLARRGVTRPQLVGEMIGWLAVGVFFGAVFLAPSLTGEVRPVSGLVLGSLAIVFSLIVAANVWSKRAPTGLDSYLEDLGPSENGRNRDAEEEA